MDAEEERRREQIREDERRWEATRERNRLEEETEHQQRRNQKERDAYHKGVETGDYTDWYTHIGRSPQEFRQGTGSWSGTSFYEVYVHPVRNALNDADRVPWESRSRWLSNLGLIRPEEPQKGRDTAQMIIREITDMRETLRPRHQRLDVSLHEGWIYDDQVRLILSELKQLEIHLALTALRHEAGGVGASEDD
jgi:hypothetical protein